MNKEIIIEENKILKLKNVLMREFKLDEEPLNKKLYMFESYLKMHKIETFGPLIIKTHIEGTDKPDLLISVLIQTKEENPTIIRPYSFTSEVKVGPCLFSRFIGKEENAGIAQSKLQVYAYEKNIVLGSESYSVYKNQTSEYAEIDTFVPIIGRLSL